MRSKQASRSSSSIIAAFTQARQELELSQSKKKFFKMTEELKQRRKIIEQKQHELDMKDPKKLKKDKKKQDKDVTLRVDPSKSEKFKQMDEHRIDLKELESRLQTNLETGLTKPQVEEKQELHGKNMLSEKKAIPWPIKLGKEFIGFFGILLMTGGTLCFVSYALSPTDPSNLYLGIVLFIVNLFTGFITFFQNAKSEAIMEGFKNFIPPETQVIRGGEQQKIQAIDLVLGDIVVVELGKRIPADLRILQSSEMKVDNSSLTGESMLQSRTSECTNLENPLETKNLAFFGTLCKEGSGKGVVIFTGDNTVIGQIANLASSADSGTTPLRRELDRFIKMVATIAVIIGLIFFILGFVIGYNGITNLIFAVGIIVGFVPEGLLATVTIALTLTARRLASRKVLVKNLEGVETLGSTSCICSDKTGTLTQNKMTVQHLWYNNKSVKGHNKQKNGENFQYQYKVDNPGFMALQECAVKCSEAKFDSSLPQEQSMKIANNLVLSKSQKDQKILEAKKEWEKNYVKIPWLDRPTIGDASESALIKFYQPIKDVLHTRSQYKILKNEEGRESRMPFNSTNKYAFVIVEHETHNSFYTLFCKGAPERIWSLCDKVFTDGQIENKTSQWNNSFEAINSEYGSQGERVLGFSRYEFPKNQYPKGFDFNIHDMNFSFSEQAFLGLISLIDPPKDSVPYAVIKCKTAGIKVIMVTGDQPVTAAAIARQCNILVSKTANEIAEEENITFEEACKKSQAVVIHGDLLTKMTIEDEGLPESDKGRLLQEWVSKKEVVFARTSPAQKLIIVTACQKLGHIVAVTGDGVNDSPAIKKADIGIAMGIAGSDVAKDAADMILLDDDFASIVIGVEEGRKIFDNLKKTISFILISNIAEAWPFLSLIVLQFPLPLSTVLVLCIDLGADLVAGTAFVFEDAELDIMTRNPRRQDDHLVTSKLLVFSYVQFGLILTAAAFFQWFITLNDFGLPSSELFFLNGKQGMQPQVNDFYDPFSPYLGNSNLKILYDQNGGKCEKKDESNFQMVDWIYRADAIFDLRQQIVYCGADGRWHENVKWGPCIVNQISPVTDRPVCFSTEANKYAQTSFYFGVVVCQFSCYFACITLKLSCLYQGLGNQIMYFGFFVDIFLMFCLAYVQSINVAFGTRDVIFIHFGICGIPFGIYLLLWNELRKFLVQHKNNQIRNFPPPKAGMPNWWQRCVN